MLDRKGSKVPREVHPRQEKSSDELRLATPEVWNIVKLRAAGKDSNHN
jgi:hypothetical protein